jgi:hypothetical protein
MMLWDWHSLGKDHLYIRWNFGNDSYRIWATDLSRLWYEELEKEDIAWRANKSKIPIDVDDANNFSILLKHMASSVNLGDIEASEPNQGGRLQFRVPIKFPKPLLEASWTFRLEVQDAEDFRKHVTIPLFERIQSQKHNELDLIQRIQDKDRVVERLLDALNKFNVDLAGIFPTLATQSSSRKVSAAIERSEAETRIPALRPFDKQTWQRGAQGGKDCTEQSLRDIAFGNGANDTGEENGASIQVRSLMLQGGIGD